VRHPRHRSGIVKHRPTVPTPPEAWLVVTEYNKVIGAFPARDDAGLLAMVKENAESGHPVSLMLDHPSLKVSYDQITIENASWLTARDNWFRRHQKVLERHLRDPRTAQVFTLAPGTLSDPLVTHKSFVEGPFPFPKGKPWPKCGLCNHRLGFFAVLDFRRYSEIPLPGGSLVLHVCTECGVVSDREAWTVTWIKEDDEIEVMGDANKPVFVGTRWEATEYPLPGTRTRAEDLVERGRFLDEGSSIYLNFSCFADKIGGHAFWIQNLEGQYQGNTFVSETGVRLSYIGQFRDSPDMEIGDLGLAYILYSQETGETIMDPHSF
jgi:hypothetical protein